MRFSRYKREISAAIACAFAVDDRGCRRAVFF
jgi:hypothetical protein